MRKMRRRNFDDLFDEMQNMFNEFQERGLEMTGLGTAMPVDVREEDGKIVVSADLPGLSKEDINLKADSEKLEISAQTSEEVKEENEKYFRRERSQRSFRRSIMWPKTIDPETVTASYDEGVLEVEAETEENNGRDIEIE